MRIKTKDRRAEMHFHEMQFGQVFRFAASECKLYLMKVDYSSKQPFYVDLINGGVFSVTDPKTICIPIDGAFVEE